MDPEQLQLVLGYAALVAVASLVLRRMNPEWTRLRIAFFAGGLLPSVGLALAIYALVRWFTAPPLPHDIDHHAMAVIGIAIVLILSAVCLVVGMIVSFLVTMIVRAR